MENINKYAEIESSLRDCVNRNIDNRAVEQFKNCLGEFKVLGFTLSKEYIKNLIVGKPAKKTEVIYKILKRAELKTELRNKYIKSHKGYSTIIEKTAFNMIVV